MLNRKMLNPDKLLLKQFKLSKAERLEMILRGLFMSQLAIPIGSAIYFLVTQVSYQTSYNGDTRQWFFLKDTWDRLPVHLQNLFHNHMFNITGQGTPEWWYTARHDFRHVLIGFLAILLVGAFGVGLKNYKPASKLYMALSVPLSFVVATITAAAGIAFFAWGPVAHKLNDFGTSAAIPYVGDLIGKGTIQLTLIGILAGLAARKVLAPTFAQLQLQSIDRNIAQGDELSGWKRFVYPGNYRNRFALIKKRIELGTHESRIGSKWLGMLISVAAPVTLLLLAFGIWLNYFGPAAGAH